MTDEGLQQPAMSPSPCVATPEARLLSEIPRHHNETLLRPTHLTDHRRSSSFHYVVHLHLQIVTNVLAFSLVWVLLWLMWSTRVLQSIDSPNVQPAHFWQNFCPRRAAPGLACTCLHRPAHHCVARSPVSTAAEATSITRREERGGGQPSRSVLTSGASYSDWQEAAAALCAVISSLSSQIIIFEEAEL